MIINLADLRLDGGTQSRAQLDDRTIAEYAEAMRGGAVFPAVTAYHDGTDYWLADGFHRVKAAMQVGLVEIEADVRQGGQRDARLFSVGANALHGLRRSNEDKRRAVRVLLDDAEWSRWSNREIARRAGVSEFMVRDMRPERCDKIAPAAPEDSAAPRKTEASEAPVERATREPEPEPDDPAPLDPRDDEAPAPLVPPTSQPVAAPRPSPALMARALDAIRWMAASYDPPTLQLHLRLLLRGLDRGEDAEIRAIEEQARK